MIVENKSEKHRFYIAAFLIVLLSFMVLTDKAFSTESENSQETEVNNAPASTLDSSKMIEDETEDETEDESNSVTVEEDFSTF